MTKGRPPKRYRAVHVTTLSLPRLVHSVYGTPHMYWEIFLCHSLCFAIESKLTLDSILGNVVSRIANWRRNSLCLFVSTWYWDILEPEHSHECIRLYTCISNSIKACCVSDKGVKVAGTGIGKKQKAKQTFRWLVGDGYHSHDCGLIGHPDLHVNLETK